MTSQIGQFFLRCKDVSNRSVLFTYLLRRRDDVSAWSATSQPIWDLTETSLRRRMPGGTLMIVLISNEVWLNICSVCANDEIIFNKFSYIQKQPPRGVPTKGVVKICSKFTGFEITCRHGCSPVNLLHIFRTPFLKNTSGWLLLYIVIMSYMLKLPSAQTSKGNK